MDDVSPPRISVNSEPGLSRVDLLLFVNLRSQASGLFQSIQEALMSLGREDLFTLKLLQVRDCPQLIEHFKLVTTPSLVKTHPLPFQVLTGTNMTEQLAYWWPRWQNQLQEAQDLAYSELDEAETQRLMQPSTEISEQVFRLSDEVFGLRQAKASLEAQLRFRERVVEILAHDLRNPLTTASLAIETLEIGLRDRDKLSDAMARQLVGQARRQMRKLDAMVTDLLQPNQGQDCLSINPLRFNLGQLCRELVQQFDSQLEAKSQVLIEDMPLDLPDACADPDRIRQVVANLLDNAVKYTPVGGKIVISAFHRTTQQLEVSVCDTGPGVPEADQDRIFHNAVRLERDATAAGYGIGLSVCDRIIKAHFGRIWVAPRVPQGSCFRFTLPVYED